MRSSRPAGFSLLEVLIAAAVLSLLAVLAYMVLLGSEKAYSAGATLAHLQERARITTDAMANELRLSGGSQVVISDHNQSKAVTFRVSEGFSGGSIQWSEPITFRFEYMTGESDDGTDENKNRLIDEGRIVRVEGGETVTLTESVREGSLSFTMNGRELGISFTLEGLDLEEKLLEADLTTSVTLRN